MAEPSIVDCDNSSSEGSDNDREELLQLANMRPEFTEQPVVSHNSAPSSTSLEIRNDENQQIQQQTPSGSFNISGGEFVGANFQVTDQNYNLTKIENVDKRKIQVNVHHHHYPEQQQQQPAGGSPEQEEMENTEFTTQVSIQLCDSIRMFYNEKIGRSGNVFRAEKKSEVTGCQQLAVKSLPYDEKNKKEAQILTKLSHKNIVSIVDSDIYHQGQVPYIYIAMELCHEQNLHDHVTENKNNNVPFDSQLSIFQAKQLVEGLSYIHSNNVIHRDLKPHNVLFSLDKKTLKIADFGISKPMTRGLSKTRVTSVGAGTDGYRAPETFNNDEISQRADIFSLGLVTYFLWSSGGHAFGDDVDDWNSNIKKNRNRDLSQLRELDHQLAEVMINLLCWMLEFQPGNRPTTTQILAYEIFGDPDVWRWQTTPKGYIGTGARSKFPDQERSGETSPSSANQKQQTRSVSDLIQEKIKISDSAKYHLDQMRYEMARYYLQKLLNLEKEEPREKLATLQQLAECQIMSDQPCVDEISEIISTCRELQLSPNQVAGTAQRHFNNSNLVRSYVMYVCASKMHKTDSPPKDAVNAIATCIWMNEFGTHVDKHPFLRPVITSYVLPSMYDMLAEFRSIEGVPDDVKVESEAWCLCNIGVTHYHLQEYKKAFEKYSEAIGKMERQYGPDADKYQILAHIYHNVGKANKDLGKFAEAARAFEQAVEGKRNAEDYTTRETREAHIRDSDEFRLECLKELRPESDEIQHDVTKKILHGEPVPSLINLKKRIT